VEKREWSLGSGRRSGSLGSGKEGVESWEWKREWEWKRGSGVFGVEEREWSLGSGS
jgi:hypothetical protein